MKHTVRQASCLWATSHRLGGWRGDWHNFFGVPPPSESQQNRTRVSLCHLGAVDLPVTPRLCTFVAAKKKQKTSGCGSKLTDRRGKPQVLVHVSTYQGFILEFRLFVFLSAAIVATRKSACAGSCRSSTGQCRRAVCKTPAGSGFSSTSSVFGEEVTPSCSYLEVCGEDLPGLVFFRLGLAESLLKLADVPHERQHIRALVTALAPVSSLLRMRSRLEFAPSPAS